MPCLSPSVNRYVIDGPCRRGRPGGAVEDAAVAQAEPRAVAVPCEAVMHAHNIVGLEAVEILGRRRGGDHAVVNGHAPIFFHDRAEGFGREGHRYTIPGRRRRAPAGACFTTRISTSISRVRCFSAMATAQKYRLRLLPP